MKWPTMDEFAQMVADKALDEVEYNGKTLRQWIEIISASELGTNLAEVGMDCISRQAAIDALHMDTSIIPFEKAREYADATISEIRNRLETLPSTQPDIIRCRECKFASGDSRICMKFGHSPIGELDFCSFAERREVTT